MIYQVKDSQGRVVAIATRLSDLQGYKHEDVVTGERYTISSAPSEATNKEDQDTVV